MSLNKIDKILRSSIPTRFQDISPSDFEDFTAKLFEDKGYKVKQTKLTGDFGADLLIEKNKTCVVQVKRYAQGNKVGVQDVNQVLGAKSYYECDKSLVITTSSFTSSAKKLAKKTNIEIWNWDKLIKEIEATYFNGENYYEYLFKKYEKESKKDKDIDSLFDCDIKKVDYNFYVNKKNDDNRYTAVFINLHNKSNKNLQLTFEMPVYISEDGSQYKADYYNGKSFKGGTVYAGSNVEIGFMFLSNKVTKINKDDKFVIKFAEDNSNRLGLLYVIAEKNYFNFFSINGCIIIIIIFVLLSIGFYGV